MPFFNMTEISFRVRRRFFECGKSWISTLSGQTTDYTIGICSFFAKHSMPYVRTPHIQFLMYISHGNVYVAQQQA